VLAVNVAPQVDLALKRPVLADVARKRLEAGVFTTVSDEIRRLTERLAALTARVRFFSCDNNIFRCSFLSNNNNNYYYYHHHHHHLMLKKAGTTISVGLL